MDNSGGYMNVILFLSYLFVAVFIMLSMFLAILAEAQVDVREDEKKLKEKYESEGEGGRRVWRCLCNDTNDREERHHATRREDYERSWWSSGRGEGAIDASGGARRGEGGGRGDATATGAGDGSDNGADNGAGRLEPAGRLPCDGTCCKRERRRESWRYYYCRCYIIRRANGEAEE